MLSHPNAPGAVARTAGAALLAAGLALATGTTALANDGYAEHGAGGLVFVEAPDGLHLASEDLTIGVDRVRVAYRFENRSGRPITATVAFPLPDIAPGHPDEAMGGLGEIADMDFRTVVDGHPVSYRTTRQALGCIGGTWIDAGGSSLSCCADYDWDSGACTPAGATPDVTDALSSLGLLDDADPMHLSARLAELAPDVLEPLAQRGAVQRMGGDTWPNWVLRIRHVREQTFPAERPVEVVHTYAPVPGAAVWGPNDIGGADTIWAVRYILRTANTWSGPIDRFSLTVPPRPGRVGDVVVVAGLEDLTFAPDGTVRTSRTAFSPRHDLTVTWFPGVMPEARTEGAAPYLVYAYGVRPDAPGPVWISPNAFDLPPGRFPGASMRPLSAEDLRHLTADQLAEMRNEIYARHGYVFKTDRWRAHFQATDWYRPNRGGAVALTPLEQANVALIQAAERALKP